jgi:hypothetical protein
VLADADVARQGQRKAAGARPATVSPGGRPVAGGCCAAFEVSVRLARRYPDKLSQLLPWSRRRLGHLPNGDLSSQTAVHTETESVKDLPEGEPQAVQTVKDLPEGENR